MVALSGERRGGKLTRFSGAEFLERLGMFSVRPGLGSTRGLERRAGFPGKNLRFIHIAGTNGKGSTGAMLEAAFRGAGFRTGFYSSPHLIDVRERFRIDGKMVSRELFDDAAEFLAAAGNGAEYTYFEFATVLAQKIFAEAHCDIVIWETGMGGRFDATNTVVPQASVITNIALDHQAFLGDTLEKIAAEKAGIIKEGVPVFVGELPPEAFRVIREQAEKMHAPLFCCAPPPEKVEIDRKKGCQRFVCDDVEIALNLPGAMQRQNFRVVLALLRFFAQKGKFDLARALAALTDVQWPARMQMIGDVIVDGGHNPDGVRALTESLSEWYPREKFIVIYGGFRDKNVAECLKFWAPLACRMIFVPLAPEKRSSFSPPELSSLWRTVAPQIPCGTARGGADAIVEARRPGGKEKIVVSGSLFLAGEVLETLRGREAAGNLVQVRSPIS